MDSIDNVPMAFLCPITNEVMKDPVVDHEGNSYERHAIETWLRHNLSSPITRNPLAMAQLSPNRALKDTIEVYFHNNNVQKLFQDNENNNVDNNDNKDDNSTFQQQMNTTEVQLEAQAVSLNDGTYCLVTVTPPAGVLRTPTDICCVIDTSGSMNDEASVKDANGVAESHGLSLLDIVKHAVGTIIEAMLPQDRLCLIEFNSVASVRLNLTQMNALGKKQANFELKKMTANGSTNFWGGLSTGLELLREHNSPGRLASLVILTDGCPTISPPRGELPMMKIYRIKHEKNFPCSVTTFGFGYSVNSDLLRDIAELGDGTYSFIPDSGLVGTVFVNSISNMLASFTKNTKLTVTPLNPSKVEVVGAFTVTGDAKSPTINLHSLQYDQKRQILLKLPSLDVNFNLQYEPFDNSEKVEKTFTLLYPSNPEDVPDMEYVQGRFAVINALKEIIGKKNVGVKERQLVKDLVTKLEQSTDERVKALFEDAQGQISEAVSKDEFWTKWGRHYLPSLMGAHLFQQCNNFKDPGIQGYGGSLFESIREQVEEIFNKLPPPNPTRKANVNNAFVAVQANSAPLQNMNAYYNYRGGCFAGQCEVKMTQGVKKVQDIRKGDKLMSVDGKEAEVMCVLKMNCPSGSTSLVKMSGGLLITSYHPVRINQKWAFPCDIAKANIVPCEAVYTFVLNKESAHIMIINDVECVTLGHNLKEDVVRHAFFGSDIVVDEMKKMNGWSEGVIEMANAETCFVRDMETGRVCGFNLNGDVMCPGA